jgi:threonyl-tRNA synthetase
MSHNGFDLAKARGFKNALAIAAGQSADAPLYDLSRPIDELLAKHPIEESALVVIGREDPRALDLIRHSSAHLLAHAVKELYPEMQVTIGPVIEHGFFYDFSGRNLTPEDLIDIEKRMKVISERNLRVVREEWNRDEAVQFFLAQGEKYKAEIIQSIPADQPITLYRQDNFIDLCRGPHVPSTGALKVFKLTKLAGAYWRGDSKNEMLQRVYGTAWATKEQLAEHLYRLEEAEKRDHRKLAKQLSLFHMQDEAPGMVFWHPKGYAIWQAVEQYLREIYCLNGYQEVKCPQIVDRSLWEKSGHWEHFKESMFTTLSESREYAVKPMNCPGHVQVFNNGLHSYRELPLRYGEFGSCHRNEPSGGLHGLMRVRGFVQDDGHIFCTEEQIRDEVIHFNLLVLKVYRVFGFTDVSVKLALRPASRVGDDATWDRAEESLRDALRMNAMQWVELPGEGAFYGPKIEFHIRDAIGRSWQCGTIQVDFSMPGRLGAEFVDVDNTRKTPVMLHRAILGSLERFIGILIEHHAGALPLWLAPVQVVLLNISEAQKHYTESLTRTLCERGIRAQCDLSNEKITYKIREHSLQKIPYLAVIGNREMENQQVALRARGGEHGGTDLGGDGYSSINRYDFGRD